MLELSCSLEQETLLSFSNDLCQEMATWVVTDHLQKRIFIDAACDAFLDLLSDCGQNKKQLFFLGQDSHVFFLQYLQKNIFQAFPGPVPFDLKYSYQSIYLQSQLANGQALFESGENKEKLLLIFAGNSQPVEFLQTAVVAKEKKAALVTFSGGNAANVLRNFGTYNFFLPLKDEKHLEIFYLNFFHYIARRLQLSGGKEPQFLQREELVFA